MLNDMSEIGRNRMIALLFRIFKKKHNVRIVSKDNGNDGESEVHTETTMRIVIGQNKN